MISLPIGKALIAVCSNVKCKRECINENYQCPIDCCKGCDILDETLGGLLDDDVCGCLCCIPEDRSDGLQVIHKLVDYPGLSETCP